jgi:hypothetical protein
MKLWYQSLSRHDETSPYRAALKKVLARAARIAGLVGDIERCGDVGKLMRLTAKPGRAQRGKKK